MTDLTVDAPERRPASRPRKSRPVEEHRIRAVFDADTIRVYQAFADPIADEVVRTGRFGRSFQLDRMTWIKPSFLWMMYRSGWAAKAGQTRVLAIDVARAGFDVAVSRSVLSSFDAEVHGSYESWRSALAASEARCQWDPDRDVHGAPLGRRTIQLGLRGGLARRYARDWAVRITDITSEVVRLRDLLATGHPLTGLLPVEVDYPEL